MRGGALRSGGGGTAEVHGWHALEQLWVALGRLLVEVPETAKTVFAFKALFVEKVVTIHRNETSYLQVQTSPTTYYPPALLR